MLSALIPSVRGYSAMPLAEQLMHQRYVHPGPLVLRTAPLNIEVPNTAVDVDSWAVSACYPQGSFYPLSDGPSTRNHRITKPYFRTCSTCMSHSQAPFCLYTLRAISVRTEGTFGRLRYSLGGDRPSQTARQTLSPRRITAPG